ncbi:ribose-5-phosphate isomerase RpiA [Chloroflexota bacterium]
MTGSKAAPSKQELNVLKSKAAEMALGFVKPGMVLGLGGGSTALMMVRRLAEFLQSGRLHDIQGVPCSTETGELALSLGIPLTDLDVNPIIDLTIDGADEVDSNLDLIKGGGGMLLREKIVAQASLREVIIVDESKLSPKLGTNWPLPVEVIPFGVGSHQSFLESLGARVEIRNSADGSFFYTEHGNLILDCSFGPIPDPASLAEHLGCRAGIVEHGLFINMATDLIVAGKEGCQHIQRGEK